MWATILSQMPHHLEEQGMAFWIGRWATSWRDPDGARRTGSNVVVELEGSVRELFEGPGSPHRYVGVSLSTWNDRGRTWQQEYWDNAGYHAFFEGGWRPGGEGDRFILDLVRGGGQDPGQRRLVWHGIEPDRLLWDYERSEDGGASWTSTWRIKYRRISTRP